MFTGRRYIVAVYDEDEGTWGKIHMTVQPLSDLYDEHGNLKDCRFIKTGHELFGHFRIFECLDKRLAEDVRKLLVERRDLIVLPVREIVLPELLRYSHRV